MDGYYLMPHPLMLMPQIGKGEDLKLYQVSLACHKIAEELANSSIQTIIILMPAPKDCSCFCLLGGKLFKGDFKRFTSDSFEINGPLDEAFLKKLQEVILEAGLPFLLKTAEGYQLDEKVLVPLSFIDQYNKAYRLVPIACPVLDDKTLYHFGMCLEQVASCFPHKTAIIASANLSHRMPHLQATMTEALDHQFLQILTSSHPLRLFELKEGEEFLQYQEVMALMKVLLGTLDGKKITGEIYAYQNPFGVGYGVVSFKSLGLGAKVFKYIGKSDERIYSNLLIESNPYVSLARKCLEDAVNETKTLLEKTAIPEIMIIHRHGVFVSLYKEDNCLGRCGSVHPHTDCVATEIMDQMLALIRMLDTPLIKEELGQLKISVELILNPVNASMGDLNPGCYGIRVSQGDQEGIVFPGDDRVKTSKDQVLLACQQANILFDEQVKIERFEVLHYEE